MRNNEKNFASIVPSDRNMSYYPCLITPDKVKSYKKAKAWKLTKNQEAYYNSIVPNDLAKWNCIKCRALLFREITS